MVVVVKTIEFGGRHSVSFARMSQAINRLAVLKVLIGYLENRMPAFSAAAISGTKGVADMRIKFFQNLRYPRIVLLWKEMNWN